MTGPRPPKPLPPVNEAERQYGLSGYTGPDAKELARQANLFRDIEMTEELFLTVCDRLVEGEPLTLICHDQTMPSRPMFMRYIHKNPQAKELYHAAQEMRMETAAEEMNAIAADDSNDFSYDNKGRRIAHNDVVQRARLRVDTLARTMAAMAPRRFGTKNFTEIQGNANQPVTFQVVTGVPRGETSLIGGTPVATKLIEGAVTASTDAESKDVE
jgi:hypothetical protein